jgi:hypothetical protein
VSGELRVVFGPRADRGVVLGLRVPQLALLVTGLAALAVTLGRGRAAALAGVLTAAGAAAGALLPVAGRTPDRWAPVAAAYLARRLAGRRYLRPAGTRARPEVLAAPPAAGLRVETIGAAGGAQVAVVTDRRRGTSTAVAAVRGGTFTLLDPGEQAQRALAWGALLAGLGREGTPVARVQWLHRTRPMCRPELDRVAAPAPGGGWAAAAASYLGLLGEAGGELVHRDMLVAVAVPAPARRRAAGHEVLLRELAAVQAAADAAGVELAGWLPPRLLAAAIRTAYAPASLPAVAARDDEPGTAGVRPDLAGPGGAEERWRCWRSDDAWHATYWIAEWPRIEVPVDVLTPLLAQAGCAHTVSVLAEPVSARAALREARAARATDVADAELRARLGQLAGARDEAQAGAAERLDAELAAGHAVYRFTGTVTVTAATLTELDGGCAEVEQAAARCHLDLRRLYGQQAEAFTWTLPLARGPR